MKKQILIILFLTTLVVLNVNGQQITVITNETISEMFTKKLPTSIIIGKIKTAQNSFDISTDALVLLMGKGLTEDIINAMVEAANDPARHYVEIDPNNPLDKQAPGIYYLKNTEGGSELVKMEPSIYSQSKAKGSLLGAVTVLAAKSKTSVTLDGSGSKMQLTEKNPEFYFYFDESGIAPAATNANWWFSVATSPNEFLLVKFIEKKQTREVTTGTTSVLGGSSVGVDDKNRADFQVEKIASGIYKVFFNAPLLGEFCFMYAGSTPTGYADVTKVYDFGVK